jgi:hypothetical protein
VCKDSWIGCTWIEMKSEVHIVDDQAHPKMVGNLCKTQKLTYLG